MKTCPTCGGSGTVRVSQRTPFGVINSQRTCDSCQGKGKIIETPCQKCGGSGTVMTSKNIEIHIPAGIDDGQTLSLRGQGNSGSHGGPSGDLLVLISVRPHPIFKRRDSDIYCEIPVIFSQAALGDVLKVPTIDGNVE